MKKIFIQLLSFIGLILTLSGIVLFAIFIDKTAHYTRIKAEFTELEPFPSNMPVFFKGFRIGKITKIEPKDDYTATQMSITLFPRDLNFPKNVYARVKSYKDDYDYVEIELPELASEKLLKNGDIIEGKSNVSFESLIKKHAESGSLDLIIEGLGEITDSVNKAVQQAGGLLSDVRTTLKSNQNYITLTAKNLSETTGSLYKTSLKIDGSVNQKTLDNTMKNLEKTTENIEQITRNIDCATRNLTDTMNQVNEISENINGITNGVNCTMKKRFGGFRLIFGKPDQCCNK